MKLRRGFTLIELLIVIAIVGILATIVTASLSSVGRSARDARRKLEVAQVGRMLTLGCYVPDAGEGDYDLQTVLDEFKTKYPQYASTIASTPRDPSRGGNTQSGYRYAVLAATRKCAVYANLQNTGEAVTLPALTAPTAGGGTGVLQGPVGLNGTNKYFQFSN